MNDVMRRKTINMIAMLIIVLAMAAGLSSPATCDDFYNKLQGISNSASEIHAITERSQRDCIVDETTAHHSIAYHLQRNVGSPLAGTALHSRTDTAALLFSGRRLSGFLTLLTPRKLCSSSVFFSSYIHLKDGQK
jgi:hypothetical protein